MKRFLTVLLAAMLLCVASFAAAEDTHWSLAEIGDSTYIALMVYGEEGDAHSVFTIDNGYFVQLDQYNEDFSDMDSTDGDFAKAILAGLGVKPVQ